MKIIWNRNRWLREHRAGYLIVGWGGVLPTTEAHMERELERWRTAYDDNAWFFNLFEDKK